ncbi:MAG: baseplate J/gp47 family protein [Selenomonas noxia]
MFEEETRLAILERLKTSYDEVKKTEASAVEGTFSFDTLAANAKEFEKAYAEMSLLIDAAFPQTSWGQYLDYLADELAGLSRRPAVAATVILSITGTAGAVVPKGSLFATESGVQFSTNDQAVLSDRGAAKVKASALAVGAAGNVQKESIVKIPVSIYGVSAVMNEAAAHGGYEEESDDDLRERLLFAVRQRATSGNVFHYVEWATSVSGVGAVKVLPLWKGRGTVKIVVADANTEQPSEETLQKVRAVIAGNAPIGAEVTVVAPTIKKIDVSLVCTRGTGNKEGIRRALTRYFKSGVFKTSSKIQDLTNSTTTISYAQVGRVLLDDSANTGVEDYIKLTLGGGTENIVIPVDVLPVVGEVTLLDT